MTTSNDSAAAPGVENPGAGAGIVVLDIGDDVGALIISAPTELAGAELEICPAGARDTTPDEGGDWWEGEWRSPNAQPHTHSHDHSHGHDHDHSHDHDGPAWPHVAVLPRAALTGACAAVFPALREGDYDVWVKPAGPTALTAIVIGGEVTTLEWPESAETA